MLRFLNDLFSTLRLMKCFSSNSIVCPTSASDLLEQGIPCTVNASVCDITSPKTYTTIDLAAVADNVRILKHRNPHCADFIAVLKCSAYGHGSTQVAQRLQKEGLVIAFFVSLVDEAIELRKSGITLPILVGAGSFSGNYHLVVDYNLTPVIGNHEDLDAFETLAVQREVKISIHLEVDMGMARLGFTINELESIFSSRHQLRSIAISGVMAHPSLECSTDGHKVKAQISDFNKILDNIATKVGNNSNTSKSSVGTFARHFATSGVLCASAPEDLHGHCARIGISMYGVSLQSQTRALAGLRPALSWYTTVVALRTVGPGQTVGYEGAWTAKRESTIATIAVGYADGYPRSLSNAGQVCIQGKRASIAGHVCMDFTMIDVTGIDVQIGTRVTLIGNTVNDPSVHEVAQWAGTVPYEVLSRISQRVPRVYKG